MDLLMTEWRGLAHALLPREREDNPAFGPVIEERLQVLVPLARLLDTNAPLAGEEFVNNQACAAALRPWDGQKAKVRAIGSEKYGTVSSDLTDYRATMAKVATVEAVLLERALGIDTTVDVLHRGQAIVKPRLVTHLRRKWQPIVNGVTSRELLAAAFNPYATLPAVYLAHAVHDDNKAMRRLAPLLRQMAQVVILGSLGKEGETWQVLCA